MGCRPGVAVANNSVLSFLPGAQNDAWDKAACMMQTISITGKPGCSVGPAGTGLRPMHPDYKQQTQPLRTIENAGTAKIIVAARQPGSAVSQAPTCPRD